MGLPAFAAYERGSASKGFGAVAVAMAPIKALNAKEAGPLRKLESEARGTKTTVKQALGRAVDAHKNAVRIHGLGALHHARADHVMNSGMDGLMLAAVAVAPIIAPVVSAMTLANILSYARADRLTKKKSGLLEDVFRANISVSKSVDTVEWHKPGYHSAAPANENKPNLDEADMLYLMQDIHQQRFVQILMGQETQIEDVEAANMQRLEKGLPVSCNTFEHAVQSDSEWLCGNFHAPIPGHV